MSVGVNVETVTAIVQVLIKVDAGRSWNDSQSIAEIRDEAAKEAIIRIQCKLAPEGFEILGELQVRAIIVDEH